MSLETIIIIIGCLILFGLYCIYRKLESLDDNFDSWYRDWQKKYDPYIPLESKFAEIQERKK